MEIMDYKRYFLYISSESNLTLSPEKVTMRIQKNKVFRSILFFSFKIKHGNLKSESYFKNNITQSVLFGESYLWLIRS